MEKWSWFMPLGEGNEWVSESSLATISVNIWVRELLEHTGFHSSGVYLLFIQCEL